MPNAESVDSIIRNFVESESQITFLFLLLLVAAIIIAIKIMKYVSKINDNNSEHVANLHENIAEMNKDRYRQREDNMEQRTEDRHRFDRRERELLTNLKRNTAQLEGIADTLKDVQVSYSSLETKVSNNFDRIETEIQSLKDKVIEEEPTQNE